jgi:DNA repair exonuclease SbcCD ATPase subunit
MFTFNLENIPTPQLKEVLRILDNGVLARSEKIEPKPTITTNADVRVSDSSLSGSSSYTYVDAPESAETKDGELMEKELIEAREELATTKKALEDKIKEVETLSSTKAELEERASSLEAVTQELNSLKQEIDALRAYKSEKEEAERKAKVLAERADKIKSMELDLDLDSDSEKWSTMSDEDFEFTVSQMVGLKKKYAQSATASVKVPDITGSVDEETKSAKETVRAFLKERKNR